MGSARRSFVILLATLGLLFLAQPALADGRAHTVVGQEYTLPTGERLGGDLVMLGGVARLQPSSVVDGNVTVVGGQAVIEGNVRGDVVAVGGTLELTAGAEVEGDLVSFGTVRRHPQATVRGDIVTGPDAARRFDAVTGMFDGRVSPSPRGAEPAKPAEDDARLGGLARQVLAFGAALAVAALVVILFPAHLRRVTEAMTSAWIQSAGVGVLTGVAAIVLAPLLAITCIGLPISLVILVALAVAILLGWAGAGQWAGAQLARATNLHLASTLGETVLGVALITLATKVPCLGFLLALPVAAWGLGAVVLTRFGTRSYLPTMPAGVSGPAGPEAASSSLSDTRRLETPRDSGSGENGA